MYREISSKQVCIEKSKEEIKKFLTASLGVLK